MDTPEFHTLLGRILECIVTKPMIPRDPDLLQDYLQEIGRHIAESQNLQEVNIFRYLYDEEILTPIGCYHSGRSMSFQACSELLGQIAAANKDIVDSSVPYQSFLQAAPVVLGLGNLPNTQSSDILYVSNLQHRNGAPNIVTVAVPITSMNKEWGVIEAVMEEEYFCEHLVRKLDRIADRLGYILHQIMLPRDLMSVLGHAESSPTLALSVFLKKICAFTLSESGAIWIKQSIGNQYQCKAQHNRPKLLEDGLVSMRDNKLVSITITEDFISRKFGDEPFGNEWLTADRNRDLIERGFNYITAVPIRSANGVIGSLSLYSKRSLHGPEWSMHLKMIEDMLRMMVSMYHIKIQEADTYRRSIVHETRNILPLIDGIVDKLLDACKGPDHAPASHILPLSKSYRQHFLQIARYMESDQLEFDIIDAAKENVDSNNVSGVDANVMLKNCTRPMGRKLRQKGVYFGWRDGAPNYFRWRSNDADLYHILNNLISNAFKYSRGDTYNAILYSLSHGTSTTAFNIQNTGVKLLAEEEDVMWNLGTRGAAAEGWNKKGMGMGLYYVKEIARVYGWEARYRWERFTEPSQYQRDAQLGWHKFSIVVPKGTISAGITDGQ